MFRRVFILSFASKHKKSSQKQATSAQSRPPPSSSSTTPPAAPSEVAHGPSLPSRKAAELTVPLPDSGFKQPALPPALRSPEWQDAFSAFKPNELLKLTEFQPPTWTRLGFPVALAGVLSGVGSLVWLRDNLNHPMFQLLGMSTDAVASTGAVTSLFVMCMAVSVPIFAHKYVDRISVGNATMQHSKWAFLLHRLPLAFGYPKDFTVITASEIRVAFPIDSRVELHLLPMELEGKDFWTRALAGQIAILCCPNSQLALELANMFNTYPGQRGPLPLRAPPSNRRFLILFALFLFTMWTLSWVSFVIYHLIYPPAPPSSQTNLASQPQRKRVLIKSPSPTEPTNITKGK